MSMNPLPPQAYTKETLLKAYAWLQNQGDSIKELATTPDILVSLFLKAKMNGESSLERPSIQNFKAELKNLAGMMGEFETGEAPHKKTAGSAPLHISMPEIKPETKVHDQPHESFTETLREHFPAPMPKAFVAKGLALDEKSLQMIHKVKGRFNLQSEDEALRMLIAVGFKKLKKI